MSKSAKVFWWIVVIVVIVWVAMSYSKKSEAPVVANGPIKIGVIAPFTGDAAVYGEPVQSGVTIALNEINKNGGINGQMVEAVFEDGKCNPKDATSAAQKLVNIDKVKVIIGGACSGETFGAAPVAGPAKVILFSPVSSAAKVSDLGGFVFRNHPNDNLAGEQLAKYAASKYKKIAIISEQTDYAQGIRGTFVDAVKANNASIVFDEAYSPDAKDFRSIVAKLKASGAEAVFLDVQTGANGALLAKQIREAGLKSQLMTAYMTGPEFVKTGSAVEGTVIVDVPGLSGGDKGQKLLSDYKKAFNKDPNYIFFLGTSYDAAKILVEAIKSVGMDTTKIADYLHSVKNYDGTIGVYSLDSKKADVIGLNLVFRQVKNGEVVEMK